jgi:hypothetical protein
MPIRCGLHPWPGGKHHFVPPQVFPSIDLDHQETVEYMERAVCVLDRLASCAKNQTHWLRSGDQEANQTLVLIHDFQFPPEYRWKRVEGRLPRLQETG